jgi:hypothetical protein
MASKQQKGKERKGKDKYLIGTAIEIPKELISRVDLLLSTNEQSSVEILFSVRQIFDISKSPTFYEQSLQLKQFGNSS